MKTGIVSMLILLVLASGCTIPGAMRTPPAPSPTASISPGSILPTASPTGTRLNDGAEVPTASVKIVGVSGAGADDRYFLYDNLYTVNADGSDLRKITDYRDTAQRILAARWSPDGRQIVFVRGGGDLNRQLVIVNADGTGVKALTGLSLEARSPAWSPDGEQIAFIASSGGQNRKIYLIGNDGSNLHPLTPASEYEQDSPEWSPKGDNIVFVAHKATGDPADYHLRLVSADGSDERRLTPFDSSLQHLDYPSWAPDGQWIAYTVWIEDSLIWFNLVSSDGAKRVEARAEDVMYQLPVWAPDSQHLAFGVISESEPSQIHLAIMNIQTLAWREVVNDRIESGSYCWFPDGSKMIYYSAVSLDGLWVVNADGTESRLVAQHVNLMDCHSR